jgi:hypothetical protein
MVGQKLNLTIDQALLTLMKLIELKLYEDNKMSAIKDICEIAIKEYAVQTSLERLERDVKEA